MSTSVSARHAIAAESSNSSCRTKSSCRAMQMIDRSSTTYTNHIDVLHRTEGIDYNVEIDLRWPVYEQRHLSTSHGSIEKDVTSEIGSNMRLAIENACDFIRRSPSLRRILRTHDSHARHEAQKNQVDHCQIHDQERLVCVRRTAID